MTALIEQTIGCPYCGEPIGVLVDESEVGHEYIEDCQVCCCPIVFTVHVDDQGDSYVTVRSENDTY